MRQPPKRCDFPTTGFARFRHRLRANKSTAGVRIWQASCPARWPLPVAQRQATARSGRCPVIGVTRHGRTQTRRLVPCEYDLSRKVIRASAALPGLFPSVEIRYRASGQVYSETHIDGGVQMSFPAIPSFAITSS
ncbi:MAG: patatin-like phospholipase family protein [Cypionkella sp.]